MEKLKLKDNVEIKDLEPFGFEGNNYVKYDKNDMFIYRVYVTRTHRFIQIKTDMATIAGSLQCLIYDLVMAGLVEKVEAWK